MGCQLNQYIRTSFSSVLFMAALEIVRSTLSRGTTPVPRAPQPGQEERLVAAKGKEALCALCGPAGVSLRAAGWERGRGRRFLPSPLASSRRRSGEVETSYGGFLLQHKGKALK